MVRNRGTAAGSQFLPDPLNGGVFIGGLNSIGRSGDIIITDSGTCHLTILVACEERLGLAGQYTQLTNGHCIETRQT